MTPFKLRASSRLFPKGNGGCLFYIAQILNFGSNIVPDFQQYLDKENRHPRRCRVDGFLSDGADLSRRKIVHLDLTKRDTDHQQKNCCAVISMRGNIFEFEEHI